MAEVKWIPSSNSRARYSDEVINKDSGLVAILSYFNNKQLELGKDISNFDNYWLHRHKNIASLWRMAERNRESDYWCRVMDRMMEDEFTREHRFFLLKHVLEGAQKFVIEDKKQKSEEVTTYTIQNECRRRLLKIKGMPHSPIRPELDIYFQKNGIPTYKAWKKFGLTWDFRIQIKHQTGSLPKWEEEEIK